MLRSSYPVSLGNGPSLFPVPDSLHSFAKSLLCAALSSVTHGRSSGSAMKRCEYPH